VVPDNGIDIPIAECVSVEEAAWRRDQELLKRNITNLQLNFAKETTLKHIQLWVNVFKPFELFILNFASQSCHE
jgi:hypothetical protein